MKIIVVSVFLSLLIESGFAQTIPTDSLYLGQTPPMDAPRVFAPGLIAKNGFFAFRRVAISANGKEFYYSSTNNWDNGGIETNNYFKYYNGKWEGPILLNKGGMRAPFLSPDGNTLYFSGNEGEVWQYNRTDCGWGNAKIYMKKKYGLYDCMMTNNKDIYAGSNGNNGNWYDWGLYDICKLNVSKTDTFMQSLGVPINTAGFDGDFYIAPDESFMIVSANTTPNFECDLYISYHKTDKSWTNPKSLGSLINEGKAHRFGAYVTSDNKYLFYSKGNNETGNTYWVRFDKLLNSLKHTNFSPYLKNKIKDQIESIGHSFIYIIPDNTFIDDDGNNTLVYSASLDNGNALPSWLSFNPSTRSFSGMPKITGIIVVKVTATDKANAFVSCNFEIHVVEK